MSGLPKIVLERLRAQSAAQPPAGFPAALIVGEAVAHPDANLLSAFVEKTLADKERAAILDHFARCADCREIIKLALPAEVELAVHFGAVAPARSRRWTILRWSALAAALGSVTIVVTLYRHPSQPPATLSKQVQPALEAVRGAEPPVPAPPAALEQRQQVPQVVAPTDSTRAAEESAKIESLPLAGGKKFSAGRVPAESKQQMNTLLAAARPPAPAAPLMAPTRANDIGGGLVPGLPRAPTRGAPTYPFSSVSQTAAQNAQLSVTGSRAQVADQEKTARTATTESSGKVLVLPEGTVPSRVASATSAPRTAQVRVESHAVELMGATARRALKSQAAPATPRWSISLAGAVQRSEDKGKTWVEVPVDGSVKFRTVAAEDSEVWVGGEQGALYHSSDAGATWKQVSLDPKGTITETVTTIQMLDAQHLALSTLSGQQWTSEDNGQTWHKEP